MTYIKAEHERRNLLPYSCQKWDWQQGLRSFTLTGNSWDCTWDLPNALPLSHGSSKTHEAALYGDRPLVGSSSSNLPASTGRRSPESLVEKGPSQHFRHRALFTIDAGDGSWDSPHSKQALHHWPTTPPPPPPLTEAVEQKAFLSGSLWQLTAPSLSNWFTADHFSFQKQLKTTTQYLFLWPATMTHGTQRKKESCFCQRPRDGPWK